MHSVALRELYHMVCLDQELLTEPNNNKLFLPLHHGQKLMAIAFGFWPILTAIFEGP